MKLSDASDTKNVDQLFQGFRKLPKGSLIENPFGLVKTRIEISIRVGKVIRAKSHQISFTRRSLKHLAEKGSLGDRLYQLIPQILKKPDEIRYEDANDRFLLCKSIEDASGRPHAVSLEVKEKDGNIIITAFPTNSKYLSSFELLWRTGAR